MEDTCIKVKWIQASWKEQVMIQMYPISTHPVTSKQRVIEKRLLMP